MNAIEVIDLHKSFGEVRAVQGVSFNVEKGEIFSLLGPNGAGKTTAILMLSCLLRPDRGDARVMGHSVREEPMAVKAVLGVVPQELALYEDLSARENLTFWGKMYGLRGAPLRRRVDEVLEMIGLADRANGRVSKYSGGMKRRVNIGLALLHKPQVIYMDEPTVGIDPQSRRSILDGVVALKDQGTTVLYTTHYMEEAQELSDRVGIIDHGELIALGTPGELIQQVGEEDHVAIQVGEALVGDELLARIRHSVEGVTKAIYDPPGEGGQDQANTSGLLVISARRGRKALSPVLRLVEDSGIEIQSVEVREPSLEAVFLHLTGRALRD
jgi:ABC-2 type transport system ATP-binding protein